MRGLLVSMFVLMVLLAPALHGQSGVQSEPAFLPKQYASDWLISVAGAARSNITAGIVHNITIPLSQASDNVTLKASVMGSVSQHNFTNNYSWTYSAGTWADDLYGFYINNASARYGTVYCFHVSVDSTAANGWWNFVVYSGGIWTAAQQYQVVIPRTGHSMDAPKFYFEIIPYTSDTIHSWLSDDIRNSSCITTKNIGNVPTTMTITYDSMDSMFSTTNSTGTFLPGQERTHYVSFQAPSWSPRQITVKGRIHCEPQLVLTPNMVTTLVATESVFEVVVKVARPGYTIFQMDGITVQYKSFYYANHRQSLSVDMWLTGNKSVRMDQDMDNVTFNSFSFQGETTSDGLLLTLTEDEEQQVVANLTCSVAPPKLNYTTTMIAYAHFDLSPEDGAPSGRLTSNIVVSPSAGGSGGDSPLSLNLTVLIVLIAVFVVVGVLMMKARRNVEEKKRQEIEERIRKKKEWWRRQR